MSDPLLPTGSNCEADFAQKVHGKVFGPRGKIRNTSTIKADYRHDGIYLHAKKVKGGGKPTQIKFFHFSQSLSDYFLTTEGIAVAKPYKLRNSISQEIIYGTTVKFTYPHNPNGGGPSTDSLAYLYRVASIGSGSNTTTENQGVNPQYLSGDIIYAIQMDDTGVKSDPKDHTTTPQVQDPAHPDDPTKKIDGPPVKITWLQISTQQAWSKFKNQTFGT